MNLTRQQAASLGILHLWPKDAPHERRPSKYRNVRTLYQGEWYASRAEAKRAAELETFFCYGDVARVERQPRFELGCPENVYIADFLVYPRRGLTRVEDVKGFVTQKFKRDLKLWRRYGEFPLWVIMGGRITIVEGGQQ